VVAPRPRPTPGPSLEPALEAPLTWVDLVWCPRRIESWIRFGAAADEIRIDRRRRRLGFAPGAVLAYVRWQGDERQTRVSRLDILQAADRGAAISTVPGVTPGGVSLLRLCGWPKVRAALAAIDAVAAIGVDPADAAPEHWRQLHNRLSAGRAPEPYSLARHRAWRLRQALDA
jgi:hypothetical protein